MNCNADACSGLTCEGLAALRHCPHLGHLSVRDCPRLDDDGLLSFAHGALTSLTSMEVGCRHTSRTAVMWPCCETVWMCSGNV